MSVPCPAALSPPHVTPQVTHSCWGQEGPPPPGLACLHLRPRSRPRGRAEGSCSQPAAIPSCPPSRGSGGPCAGLEAWTPFSSLRPRMDSKPQAAPGASSQLPTGAPAPALDLFPTLPPCPLEPRSDPQTPKDSGPLQPLVPLPGCSSQLGWAACCLSLRSLYQCHLLSKSLRDSLT